MHQKEGTLVLGNPARKTQESQIVEENFAIGKK